MTTFHVEPGWVAEHVAVAAGVALYSARTAGPADRTLLVVHGGPDWDGSYLRDPLDRLAPAHRVVVPDLRGCGRSTTGLPPGACTPDAVVGDLVTLVDVLGGGPVDVLGFSWGGLIAQRLADAAPDRVRRLVLASTSVLPVDEAQFGDWPERTRRRAAEAAVWADPARAGPALARAAALAGAPANVWRAEALPGWLDRLAAVRFSGDWLAAWRATGALPSPRLPDPVARLAATGTPVLLLHGRQDMVFPAALAEEAAARLPDARSVLVEEAGHMAHVDQPEPWLAAVREFLG
ncbi:alpha/beta fold hydrolase [Modestobacter italicus]|uniref:alpha/beta fold hydrolase n=1 Tax=Modestobacter italicus (strain DSM 44449 / CECT 9708 / BC 501) TaxID=2732864 RepID=UPI001C9691E0|nr:alpha/beta hydrolase [Modestobacter italicus]